MKRAGGVVLLGLLSVLALVVRGGPAPAANAEPVALHPPASTHGALPGFLTDDAGISAWVHISQTIRLDYVKLAFRVVEDQTEDYLIGSVAVPGYDITYDPHVYVHKDGWLVAYYLDTDPVSKILDWRGRVLSPTHLERVLEKVAEKDALTLPEINHYDFRYPDATHMLLIKKNLGTFYVDIPSSYEVYNRTWVLGANCYGPTTVTYKLDGVQIAKLTGSGWKCQRGTFQEEQLLPDFLHTFNVSVAYAENFSALALIYKRPE